MEILCPNCQKRLNIADEYSGRVMRCPMCQGMFTAPALAPASVTAGSPAAPPAPPPAPPPVESFQPVTGPAVAPPPPPGTAPTPPPPPEPPAPPPPPGEFSRTFAIQLKTEVLIWFAPVCLGVIFLLSFFPWVHLPLTIDGRNYLNLWDVGFGGVGDARFVLYMLLTFFLGLPLTIALFLMVLKVIPLPPHLHKLLCWRHCVSAGLILAGFLIFLFPYLSGLFATFNLTSLWMKLAFRVHFVALVASALDCWLEMRKCKNLPLPKLKVRW